jgi:hypothetical protein
MPGRNENDLIRYFDGYWRFLVQNLNFSCISGTTLLQYANEMSPKVLERLPSILIWRYFMVSCEKNLLILHYHKIG